MQKRKLKELRKAAINKERQKRQSTYQLSFKRKESLDETRQRLRTLLDRLDNPF